MTHQTVAVSPDFDKMGGILPVIVQDYSTRNVLTLAYCNREALDLTLRTRRSWFWSRSRKKLWMKGEESGNVQEVVRVVADCDLDALIYVVNPSGPACHTGQDTCFHHDMCGMD